MGWSGGWRDGGEGERRREKSPLSEGWNGGEGEIWSVKLLEMLLGAPFSLDGGGGDDQVKNVTMKVSLLLRVAAHTHTHTHCAIARLLV